MDPTYFDKSQIAYLSDEREKYHAGRISTYRRFIAAFEDAQGMGYAFQANYADGRPALRALAGAQDDLSTRPGAPNFIYPVVRDLAAIYGAKPNITVPAETQDPNDDQVATKRTRIQREQWSHSKMGTQCAQTGLNLAKMGDSVITCDIVSPQSAKEINDPTIPAGVYYNTVSPQICFPTFIGGKTSRRLDDLVIIDHMQVDEIERRWNVKVPGMDDEERAKVITYYGKWQRTIVVADKVVENYQHKLGFCPAVWVSKEVSDGPLARSDIAQAVDLNLSLKALYFLLYDSVAWSVYPIIVTVGGQQAFGGQRMEVGPGSAISVNPGGDVKVIAPQANPMAAEMIYKEAFNQFLQIVGISPIRIEGQIDKSNVSARSVHSQQGPMQSRVNQAYVVIGDAYEQMNAIASRMLTELPEFNSRGCEMSLYGADDNGIFNEGYVGKDMGGWTRSTVSWESFIGSDKTERLHNALLMFQANPKGYPWRRVLQEAGEEDPKAIIAEAEAAMKAMEQYAQPQPGDGATPPPGGAPPPGPSAPPGAGAAGPAMPPPQGGAAPPPGVQLPPFPSSPVPSNQEGNGTPAPVPDVIHMLQTAVASVPLQGRILDGPRLQPGGVYVKISDFRDSKPLKDALTPVAKQIDPKYTVTVKVESSKKGSK